jgi:hypothetical protein
MLALYRHSTHNPVLSVNRPPFDSWFWEPALRTRCPILHEKTRSYRHLCWVRAAIYVRSFVVATLSRGRAQSRRTRLEADYAPSIMG